MASVMAAAFLIITAGGTGRAAWFCRSEGTTHARCCCGSAGPGRAAAVRAPPPCCCDFSPGEKVRVPAGARDHEIQLVLAVSVVRLPAPDLSRGADAGAPDVHSRAVGPPPYQSTNRLLL